MDLSSGELHKHGVRIRLQDQPFQVLVLLLAHPGEVVTREELRKKLWPAETFVDFEQGLNSAILRLRAALNDSAEHPRFIETLPRRGYRFIAAIDGPRLSSAEPEPLIGRRLGRYRIVERIGEGGMGVVYRAWDEHLGRDIAVKVLPEGTLANEATRKRFRKEAEALSKLNHPNIQTVFDFDSQDGVDFLVGEYIAGITLSDKLAAGALPEKEIGWLGTQLAEGLAAAHAQGVVHGDLKPGNLRVTPDGRLKILDFGLAKLLPTAGNENQTESLSEFPVASGTPPYMAPEQLCAEAVDARTDIYALGAVLYEMATGQQPFQEKVAPRLIEAILHRLPVPPRDVNERLSPELERITLKCLEKLPRNRYESAREASVDLRRLAPPGSVLAIQPAARARFGWQVPAAVAGSALLLLAALLATDVAGLRRRLLGTPAAAPQIHSIAVMPLENHTGDAQQEYFVDGMTETITAGLAQIGALDVRSRTSVMQYKGTKKSLPQIARELNVDAVVEGSVTRDGNRVRITAQLIHAASDRHLWTGNYERDLTDILRLQSEVAQAIATEIQIKLTPQEQSRLAATRPVNPEAYEAYLKGRFYWNERSKEGFEQSIKYFEQAVRQDPNYAQAYAGLADSYNLLGLGMGELPPVQTARRAKEAARKALALDDSLAEAHAALGFTLYRYDWNWAAAEKEFLLAIELNPRYGFAHRWYEHFLQIRGRETEAAVQGRRAEEMEPSPVLAARFVKDKYMHSGSPEQAIAYYRQALKQGPGDFRLHLDFGGLYMGLGKFEEAIVEFKLAAELTAENPLVLSHLANAYARQGKRLEAERTLGLIKGMGREGFASFAAARIHALLGQRAKTLAWLKKAYEERAPSLTGLNNDEAFRELRSDPRFVDLVRRVGLPLAEPAK